MKAIVFDLDDTLTDFSFATTRVEAFISVTLARKYAIKNIELLQGINRYRHMFSSSIKRASLPIHNSRELWFSKLFAEYKIKESPKTWELRYWSMINKTVRLFVGVISLLDNIKLRKYLFTDSDGKKVFKMQRIKLLGIRRYFDDILLSDDVGINKPSKKVFKKLLQLLGVEPWDAFIVGDDPILDLKVAKDMGFKTIWTTQAWPNNKVYDFVDYKIDNLLQLKRLLKRYI